MSKRRKSIESMNVLQWKKLHDNIERANKMYDEGIFKYLRFWIHFLAVLQFAYGIIIYFTVLEGSKHQRMYYDPVKDWGGKYKYLTFLNLVVQAVYHSIALLNDIYGSNSVDVDPMPALRKIRDYVFASWAFPLAFNVSISFWVIYAYDRELIFPTSLDSFYPNWLNHIVHSNVALMILFDLCTCCRGRVWNKYSIAGCIGFMASYIIWIHIVQSHSGYWVYPILDILNLPLRYLLLSLMLLFNLALFYIGKSLNSAIWAPEMKLIREKEKLLTD